MCWIIHALQMILKPLASLCMASWAYRPCAGDPLASQTSTILISHWRFPGCAGATSTQEMLQSCSFEPTWIVSLKWEFLLMHVRLVHVRT